MDGKQRNFFATVVQQSKQLSECRNPKAALIVRGESICGIGYNKCIFAEEVGKFRESTELHPVFTSPIFEAIRSYLSGKSSTDDGREVQGSGGAAFLTYFPHIDELKLLYQADIHELYFFGDIDDELAVEFLNNVKDTKHDIDSKKAFFEITQLESAATE